MVYRNVDLLLDSSLFDDLVCSPVYLIILQVCRGVLSFLEYDF